jgi:hypothetical protein
VRLKIPSPQQAIAFGSRLLLDREWYRYLRELAESLASHTHDGHDSATIDHGTLDGLGDNDHPQYSLTSHGHDHGDLSGNSDDDHTQYAKLSGRAGGQTLIGGSASGDPLVLQSNSSGANGAVSVAGSYLKIGASAVLPMESGRGLMVDPSAPTFGWRDILGHVVAKNTGASAPDWVAYRTSGAASISQYRFTNGHEHECWLSFHSPHDYVPGTDLYIHTHWSQITVDTGGAAGAPGKVEWVFDVSYADGHGTPGGTADPFTAPFITSVVQQGSTTQYGHMIAEAQLTNAGGDSTHLDRNTIKVDGIVMVRLHCDSAHSNHTLNQDPFVHFVDIHYQSNGMGTKQKSPDFYS